jgi:hypothetical protein
MESLICFLGFTKAFFVVTLKLLIAGIFPDLKTFSFSYNGTGT